VQPTRRQILSGALAAAVGGLGVYSWQIEPHWVEWVRRPLPVRGLPHAFEGAVLVQMSDLHVGHRTDSNYVIRCFRQVAALAPDIVVVTGDFISYHPTILAQSREVYAHLPRGRLATLGVLGNHDYGIDWAHPEVAEELSAMLATCGMTVLRDQLHDVAGLQVVGLDDLYGTEPDRARLPNGLDLRGPSLVLAHNPDTADLPGWEGYEGWILSGHTHGGQCKPPLLDPPLVPVSNRRYIAGPVVLGGGRQMYINRGLGHLTRVRFNVRPEITVFHLTAA
jgi:predicted MPP superfamily phosphohydrolase